MIDYLNHSFLIDQDVFFLYVSIQIPQVEIKFQQSNHQLLSEIYDVQQCKLMSMMESFKCSVIMKL